MANDENDESSFAVKSMIVNDGKLLIVKRADDDRYMPGIWEIPGGKAEDEESLSEALIRETLEETGLSIVINREISVRDFKIKKKEIEMHIYLCSAIDIDKIKLSCEHSLYEWVPVEKAKEKISDFYFEEIDILLNLENDKWP
jgi:8-oxo-dGTP diphosphatase